jgi:hypothetical protein
MSSLSEQLDEARIILLVNSEHVTMFGAIFVRGTYEELRWEEEVLHNIKVATIFQDTLEHSNRSNFQHNETVFTRLVQSITNDG